jgi:hypothetical protein
MVYQIQGCHSLELEAEMHDFFLVQVPVCASWIVAIRHNEESFDIKPRSSLLDWAEYSISGSHIEAVDMKHAVL